MAARRLPLRWLLVPDERFNAASLNASGASQAGARPGTVRPEDDGSQLALRVSGAQDSEITFKVTDAGLPGTVRVGYWLEGETVTAKRGWIPPNTVTASHWLSFGGALTTGLTAVDAVADPVTGRVLIAAYKSGTVYVAVLNPATQAAVTISATAVSFPTNTFAGVPSLVRLPTGQVLMTSGRTYVLRSDDFGATWSSAARQVEIDEIAAAYTARRTVRHAASGALVHLAWTKSGGSATAITSVSYDDGASWTETDAGANSKTGDWVSIASTPAGVFTWIVSAATGVTLRRGAPNAELLSGPSLATFGTEAYAAGVGWAEDDGTLWFSGRDSNGVRDLWVSTDDGATWRQCDYACTDVGTADAAWSPSHAVAAGGATWALEVNPGGTTVNVRRLGGWSTLAPSASASSAALDLTRVSLGGRYLAGGVDTLTFLSGFANAASPTPTQRGWTETTSGSPTITEGISGWKITSTAGQSVYYASAAGWSADVSIVFQAQLYVESGGSASASEIAIRVDAVSYVADVCFTTTQIVVADVNGSSTWTLAYDTTTPFCIVVVVVAGRVSVLVRRPYQTTWTEVADWATLTSSGTGAAVRWGHLVAGTGPNVSHWQHVGAIGMTGSAKLVDWSSASQASMAEPVGRSIGPSPVPLGDVAADGQTFVAAVDGPGMVGEVHVATPTYDYPATNLLWQQSPSPRRLWRSTSDDEQVLDFTLLKSDGLVTQTSPNGLSHVGVVVRAANFPELVFQGWDGAGYEDIGTVSLVVDTGLTWSRQGDVVILLAGGSRHLWEGELVGGTVVLNGVPLRILEQHAGRATSGGAQPVLRVGGTGAEIGAAGSSGTSGTLWAPSACAVFPNRRTRYEGFRLVVSAATTAEGYHEAGLIAVCSAHGLGQEWDWGWSWSREAPAVQRRDLRDGGARYRAWGPTVRLLEVAWPNGVSAHQLRGDLHDWVELEADGTWSTQMVSGSTLAEFPVAAGDVPWLVDGLFAALKGGATPCALINAATLAGPDVDSAISVTDPTTWLWGNLQTSVALEHQLGDDVDGEVYRVQTLTLREAS
jgi:hypothetical protein